MFVATNLLVQFGCGWANFMGDEAYLWPPDGYVMDDPCCDSDLVLPFHVWVSVVNIALTLVTMGLLAATAVVVSKTKDTPSTPS